MIAFAKRTVTVNSKEMTYQTFTRRYVCNQCGGGLTEHHSQNPQTGEWVNWVQCGNCGERADFVTERRYEEQIAEGYEVLQGLPAELRGLLAPKEEQCQSATEAIGDLYG